RGEKTFNATDVDARRVVETLAMQAVIEHERLQGYEPRDVSKQNLGWDIESMTNDGTLRLIEVKGRHHEATTVTVTRNEIMACLNKPELFIVALVIVKDGVAGRPKYIRHFIKQEPDWAVASINYDLRDLVKAMES
ncbi:MAG TPA: DUF3883 domain-containing protein, partial [bacterium]|nr:DUF3883 domain-containing protein [bacterium]